MKAKIIKLKRQLTIEEVEAELAEMDLEIMTAAEMVLKAHKRATRLREGLGGATLQAPPPSIPAGKLSELLAKRTRTQLSKPGRTGR